MLSALNRTDIFKQLYDGKTFDLLIIGGGITGAGIALDAAKRGMSVALVEMQDFAAGTSSRSTKLVHGGLRYLKQMQIKVVSSSGKERAIVYENGPHVTTPEWMLLPMHKGGTFGKFSTSIGLRMYDFLAGVKPSERRKMLSRIETLQKEPLVKPQGLKGGGYYVEYRTDDARLTIEVIKKAVEYGATVINYVRADRFNYTDHKKLDSVEVTDLMNNTTHTIRAKKVINAAGPWVDEVRNQDYAHNNKHLRLTKGIHLVVDQKYFPLKQAVYFDTEKDGRMIFAVPRAGKAYVGTTDTVFEQAHDKTNPHVTIADRDYLIDAINYMFPEVKMTPEKVESSWAGIRPLIWEEGKDPSEISRKDEIWESESGLLTIAGGKLTGYRHMAEEIVDRVALRLHEEYQLNFNQCATIDEKISGGEIGGAHNLSNFITAKSSEAPKYGLEISEGKALAAFYGANVDQLYHIAQEYSTKNESGLPLVIYARLIYAIEQELTLTPLDFFVRRTGALYFDIHWVNQYKMAVINTMQSIFNWDRERLTHYTEVLDKAIFEATHFTAQSPDIVKSP